MVETIGILGGTFDPVHHGHIRAAIECRERLGLDEVRLMPINTPDYRNTPFAKPAQRLEMLGLAIAGISGLVIDDREIKRGDTTYTIDTLIQLREQHKSESIGLIIGSDAFRLLHTWNRWQELLNYAHIIIPYRPGYPAEYKEQALSRLIAEHGVDGYEPLHEKTGGSIVTVEIPLLDISATRIRDIIKNGQDPAGLLPAAVIKFIYKHKLYIS